MSGTFNRKGTLVGEPLVDARSTGRFGRFGGKSCPLSAGCLSQPRHDRHLLRRFAINVKEASANVFKGAQSTVSVRPVNPEDASSMT